MVEFDKYSVWSFDIETDFPFNVLTPPVMSTCTFYNGSISITFEHPKQAREFIFSAKKDTIFVAHNLEFEYFMLFAHITQFKTYLLPFYSEKSCFDLNWSYPARTKLNKMSVFSKLPRYARIDREITVRDNEGKRKTKRCQIHLIDTMNFHQESLESLMDVYTPHLKVFKNQSKYGFDLARNLADCEATWIIYTSRCLQSKMRFTHLQPALSIAMLSKWKGIEVSGYRWKGKSYRGRPSFDQYLLKVMREAQFGGICWINPRYQNIELNNYCYLDVNSMYWVALKKLKVAVDFKYSQSINVEDCQYVLDSYENQHEQRIFKLSCYVTEPCLPVRNKNGSVDYPSNTFVHGSYCENEVYYAIKSGKIAQLRLTYEYVFETIPRLFEGYIDELYKLKRTAENPIDRLFAKILGNSFYGKWSQLKIESLSYSNEEIENMPEFELYLMKREKNSGNKVKLTHKKKIWSVGSFFGGVILNIPTNRYSEGAIPIISIAVTSECRGWMWSHIDVDNTAFVDTDCVVVKKDNVENYVISEELGDWKNEKTFQWLVVHGKKDYEFVTDDGKYINKSKGVLKNGNWISDRSVIQDKIIKVKEGGVKGIFPYSVTKQVKNLTTNYPDKPTPSKRTKSM